jgi:hypothetical protein
MTMDNGFVGVLDHIPAGYRCYILFLPNESMLDGVAENFIMRHFWEAAASMGPDVLFAGLVRGEGLSEARRGFELDPGIESFFVLLDTRPTEWKAGLDPIAKIPLGPLKTEYEVLELLHLLVTVSRKPNFIGRVNRKETFDRVKQLLGYLPTIGSLIKFVLPP